MIAKSVILLLIFLICDLHRIAAQLEEGDLCSTPNGERGECKFPSDCPSSLKDLGNTDEIGKCGFVGTRAIICCRYQASVILDKITTTVRSSIKPSTPEIKPKQHFTKGTICKKKCKEYTRYAYPDIDLTEYGTVVSVEEFPHMVQIGYDSQDGIFWGCGGSIISESFILTAAHCLKRSGIGTAKYVRAGVIHEDHTQKEQMGNVAECFKYPDYVSKYHDIGLIKLEKPLSFNQFVRPACLFTKEYYPFNKTIVTGWGKNENSTSSNKLLKATLDIYPVDQCNETYRNDISKSLHKGIVDEYMICAGSSQKLTDTCQGDSGGPLQYKMHKNMEVIYMYHIIGITSFGKSCGVALNMPGVYTRVSAYTDWIEGIVWPSET